ncbi:PDDEXK family nuclease [Nocardioides acrostichi]|uniref:Transcriptional regulator, AbiEi antitoxin, Type IV TA system n=1 Tax=Nocardioides acrostichi TaxID=2784339 RepID=A0A930Y7W1_9ACTN|nr:hypothetical protein [Nocardioides acrostichi]MBF4163850.1 hypothetical protein [Nocardioides acrostichi]
MSSPPGDPVVLRRDVLASGGSDKELYASVRRGDLVRIRQGAYCPAPIWESASAEEQHLLRVRAVLRQYAPDVAVSHLSAAVAIGAPLLQALPTQVHLTHLDATGDRHQAAVTHHRGACTVEDLGCWEDHWITSPTRTTLDCARLLDRDAAVCLLDWMLQQGHTTKTLLRYRLSHMRTWPKTLAIRRYIDVADPASESVGETLARLLFLDHGLPLPRTQLEVYDQTGRLIGRLDFAWPELATVVEFDGREKYTRYLREGESATDAVLREKAREDAIREVTGWTVVRITWADVVHRPAQTVDRIRRAMASRAA